MPVFARLFEIIYTNSFTSKETRLCLLMNQNLCELIDSSFETRSKELPYMYTVFSHVYIIADFLATFDSYFVAYWIYLMILHCNIIFIHTG